MNGITNAQQQGGGGGGGGAASITYTKIESTIPTSAWVSSAPSWIGQNALTWTEIDTTSLGFKHGGYFVQGGTKDLGLTADKTYTISLLIDGTDYNTTLTVIEDRKVIGLAQAGGVNLQIVDHAISVDENLNYTDGNGYVVVIIPDTVFTSIVITEFSGAGGGITATISNSAIKTNSAVTMYIDYNGKIKAAGKADGSLTLSASATPTVEIPYAIEITDTNVEGLFEVVNNIPQIQSNWAQTDETAADYIKNKPSLNVAGEWQTGTFGTTELADGTYEIDAFGTQLITITSGSGSVFNTSMAVGGMACYSVSVENKIISAKTAACEFTDYEIEAGTTAKVITNLVVTDNTGTFRYRKLNF